MFLRLVSIFFCCVLASFSDSMVKDSSTCREIAGYLGNVYQLFRMVKESELSSYRGKQGLLDEFCTLLNRSQNVLFNIIGDDGEHMTPEEAGDVVRGLKLDDGELVFDESSVNSLLRSFEKMRDILLGRGREITSRERAALLLVLECYANAVPGELTYSFDDEEQADIVDAAIGVWKAVR